MTITLNVSFITFATTNTTTEFVISISELSTFDMAGSYTTPVGKTLTSVGVEINHIDINVVPISANDCNLTVHVPDGGATFVGTLNDATSFSSPITGSPVFGPYLITLDPDRLILFNLSPVAANPPPPGVTVTEPVFSGPDYGIFIKTGDILTQITSLPSSPTLSVSPFCVHPDSLVHTTRGLVKISDLRSDQDVTLIDANGQLVKMIANAKFTQTNKFVCISPGALGPNQPSTKLLITGGHPVKFGSHEIISQRLVNNSTVNEILLDTFVNVYSMCTTTRTFVMINNIPVGTWDYDVLLAKQKAGKCLVEFL
jgi:hypothetical protein